MLDVEEVIRPLPAGSPAGLFLSDAWKCLAVSQVRTHLMGGRFDTASLSPADGGKLCSLFEGREKAKDSVALMQTAAPAFPLSLNLSVW